MPSAVSGVGRVSGVSGVGAVSEKGFVPTVLLCFLLGVLGVHRFYVGKIGTGILQLVTLGGLGIWAMIDFILIIVGKFTDKDGRAIKPR
jgi:TM2 domain-containing membrane protein YozV